MTRNVRPPTRVDIAVFGNDDTGQRVLLAIGEAKWQEALGAGHLARLQRVRELLVRNGQPGAQSARLLCFGGAEPSGQLRRTAAAGEVRLVGLDELYGFDAAPSRTASAVSGEMAARVARAPTPALGCCLSSSRPRSGPLWCGYGRMAVGRSAGLVVAAPGQPGE
jgi:hypothetical protein